MLRRPIELALYSPTAVPKPVSPGRRRLEVVCDGEWRDTLVAAAQAAGVSLSDFVRGAVEARMEDRAAWSPADREAVREVAREVRAVGRNLNRLQKVWQAVARNPDLAGLVASKAPPDALERALERVERALAVLERRIEEW